MDAFIYLLAVVIMAPILTWTITYFVILKGNNKARAFRRSADVTTLFFIFSVYFIMKEIWEESFLWLIIVELLGSAILFTFLQWNIKNEVDLMKVLKGVWRFNFLIFVNAYFILLVYGMIIRIIHV